MSTLYLLTLIGAIVAITTVMLDAVIAATRRPHWQSLKVGTPPDMAFERRTHVLPFVGAERRDAVIASNPTQPEPLRQAA